MFDTTQQKGLFTFYWEQSNSNSVLHSKVQSLAGTDISHGLVKSKKKIQESKVAKQQVQSKIFMPKEELRASRKYVLNQIVSNRSREKGEEKSTHKVEDKYLTVWDMDLEKTFPDFIAKNEVRLKDK